MNSRQVQYVLIALIVLGIAAGIVRLVSAGTQDDRLTGLLPMTVDVVDQIIIRSPQQETQIRKVGADVNTWRVGEYVVDAARFSEFWVTVGRFEGAQLVSTNPANHTRMGVDEAQAVEVRFMLGGSVQERFLIGVGSENVALCYLRREGRDNVYAVPCRFSDLFDPNPDAWRDPVIVNVPLEAIAQVTLRYPTVDVNRAITVNVAQTQPTMTVTGTTGQLPVNVQAATDMMNAIRQLIASGFATNAEANALNFDVPDASVLLEPRQGTNIPTTRVLFIQRDADTFWVRNTANATVYIVGVARVAPILLDVEDLAAEQ